MKISFRGEELILDKERALYLPKEKLLAISDLHLGKAAHFRKAGLAIPNAVSKNDLERLSALLHQYQPEILLINGDMFHSDHNSEIDEFIAWRQQFSSIEFILVKGNHDKQHDNIYAASKVTVKDPTYQTNDFCFIHDAFKCDSPLYSIGGHIHPGVRMYNKAKQSIKLPCFYFGNEYAILPAFSTFTGLQLVQARENDAIYAVTPSKIVEI